MSRVTIILIIIAVILLGVLVALYFIGKRLQARQEQSNEQIQAMKQPMTMLVIDKKRLKLKESGLPDQVIQQTLTVKCSVGTPVQCVGKHLGEKGAHGIGGGVPGGVPAKTPGIFHCADQLPGSAVGTGQVEQIDLPALFQEGRYALCIRFQHGWRNRLFRCSAFRRTADTDDDRTIV